MKGLNGVGTHGTIRRTLPQPFENPLTQRRAAQADETRRSTWLLPMLRATQKPALPKAPPLVRTQRPDPVVTPMPTPTEHPPAAKPEDSATDDTPTASETRRHRHQHRPHPRPAAAAARARAVRHSRLA